MTSLSLCGRIHNLFSLTVIKLFHSGVCSVTSSAAVFQVKLILLISYWIIWQ